MGSDAFAIMDGYIGIALPTWMVVMLNPLMCLLLALAPSAGPPPAEPAGVRASGLTPPFQAEPFPPDWLRMESHALADPDCHHYAYEAYSDGTHWLARYIMLPEEGEGFLKIEQLFLFPKEHGRSKPERIEPAKIQIEPTGVIWKGRTFKLVDRRDLIQN